MQFNNLSLVAEKKVLDVECLDCLNAQINGYGVSVDKTDSWNFGDESARNDVIFGVYNSSSACTDNRKNNFLMLGEEPTDDINGGAASIEKKFCINFSKAKKNIFCLSLHCNGGNNYLF